MTLFLEIFASIFGNLWFYFWEHESIFGIFVSIFRNLCFYFWNLCFYFWNYSIYLGLKSLFEIFVFILGIILGYFFWNFCFYFRELGLIFVFVVGFCRALIIKFIWDHDSIFGNLCFYFWERDSILGNLCFYFWQSLILLLEPNANVTYVTGSCVLFRNLGCVLFRCTPVSFVITIRDHKRQRTTVE
jgi:hypothetical protein